MTKHQSCPCLHITPCDPRCTCVYPISSRGCSRCCTYGSKEQRRAAAERIASSVDSSQKIVEWGNLSDAGLRLRLGEITAQEIRTVRAVLTSLLTP